MPQYDTNENRKSPEVINIKRNPYLVDYEKQRGGGRQQGEQRRAVGDFRQSRGNTVNTYDETMARWNTERQRRVSTSGRRTSEDRGSEGGMGRRTSEDRGSEGGTVRRNSERRGYENMPGRRRASGSARRKQQKKILYQKFAIGIWVVCILSLAVFFFVRSRQTNVAAGKNERGEPSLPETESSEPSYSGILVQGLPAEEFAKHPYWTENFLTPNEYSRPGDPLEEVKNVFVHYTANKGTSAAQNRSYFERQKDEHDRSVSSHFIIGYEGEIIQCVPLDEIAYAVATRNEDSVSIECCYLADDGSFTQETYDSLIDLLVWLTDMYDLEKDDILRHYDSNGKKCPIYYVENEDEWEQLKQDVEDKRK